MAFYGLRLEYPLEGSLNYIAWKDRMEAVLEDNGWKEFIDQEIPKPASTNAQQLVEWKKCVEKVRWIILEAVRDHIVSSFHGKDTPFSMWNTLKDLYSANRPLSCMPQPTSEVAGLGHVALPLLPLQQLCSSSRPPHFAMGYEVLSTLI